MANFIISPYAISFDSIKNNLQDYVTSKPEGEGWKDFYASSAGQTIIEIAAALGAFYAYQFIVGRREAFLSVASNYTSLIGLAENLGYSVSRGQNLKLSLNIVPNQTITLPKWTIVGGYSEYDVVLTEDVILNEGIATDIPVVIGNLLQETQNITSNKLTQFIFSNANVTDDYRLVLNNDEVPSDTNIKEALNDKYIALSNVFGSVDVFYLNTGNYKYASGDTLYLQFIERNNLDASKYSNSGINIFYANQVNEFTILQDRIDKETPESIKLKAPIYHETSMVIRSRRDYSKYILAKNPSLITANDHDIYPGLIEITYLKDDETFITQNEKEDWLKQIEEARPNGVAEAIVADPVRINKTLNVSLWRKSDSSITTNISDEIDNILSKYENTFEASIDLTQVEHDIENLDGVKIARVDVDTSEWKANTSFKPYDIITTSKGDTFYAGNIVHLTGETEPNWPLNINETVIDGEIIWRKTNDFKATVINKWSSNTSFSKYDYIRVEKVIQLPDEDPITDVSIFVVDGFVGKSGSVEPEWGDDTVYDNGIIWNKTLFDSAQGTWKNNTYFSIGDIITINDISYACAGFIGRTSSIEPDWETISNGLVIDGNITWTLMNLSSRVISLGWNEYLKLAKTYQIVG